MSAYQSMNEKAIKEYYEKHPEGIPGTSENPEIHELHKLFIKYLKLNRPKRILDMGCGKGYLGESITKESNQYYGFDISLAALKIARSRLKDVSFCAGSVCNLPFPDSCFDMVICSEVIEHVPDYPKAIRELSRVLKCGKIALISTPNLLNPDLFSKRMIGRKYTSQLYDRPIFYKKTINEFQSNPIVVEHFTSIIFFPPLRHILPRILNTLMMKIIQQISRITQIPLGLHLFFICRKKEQ